MPKNRKNRTNKNQTDTIRVAIVGGGCAGLTAAWELSKLPGYQVEVFERSQRLGGKGASWRDADGQIREHGLHIWLGFYENAFRMMRECYTEVRKRGWGPDKAAGHRLAHGSLEEAFFPEPHLGVAIPDSTEDFDLDPGKRWVVWSGLLPPAKGMPGDELDEKTNPFTLVNYLLRCFELLKALMHSVVGPPDAQTPGAPRPEERSKLDEAIELNFAFDPTRSPAVMVETMARYLRAGALTTAAGLLQAVTILEEWLKKLNHSPEVADTALQLMEAIAAQTRKLLRDFVAVDQNLRFKTEIIDIVITIAVGLYRDRVLFDKRGLDAINHIDYKEWLLQHGATKTSVNSQFINGIYDLTFAYRDGDRTQPALAAGVALRGALRMFFTYRGSMFWRMRSGMGDAVFAPLYKVLEARKVKFNFLHALEEVELGRAPNGDRYVTRLRFAKSGELPAGKVLDHFGCWPGADAGGAAKRKTARTLDVAEHFDRVIFAMGVDDFVEVFSRSKGPDNRADFFEEMPAEWDGMRRNVKTVATRAAQVWLTRDLDQLGWYRGPGIITAFQPPFETWADMTQTLASEKAWRAAKAHKKVNSDSARSIAYFCGVLPENEVAGDVEKHLDDLLKRKIKALWPGAFKKKNETAATHAITRHAQANVQGSERYTLSLPGSIEHRISPLDRSILNMAIAGDWTAAGLDAGCIETAVMSGMLAAFAITNDQPPLESIVGYDHP